MRKKKEFISSYGKKKKDMKIRKVRRQIHNQVRIKKKKILKAKKEKYFFH